MKVTKKTRLLAGVPIAQSPDGLVKVMNAKDSGQSAVFTFGHDWDFVGCGFNFDAKDNTWTFGDLKVKPDADGELENYLMPKTRSADGKSCTLVPVEGEPPAAGTYPNAEIQLKMFKFNPATEDSDNCTLKIPIKLVVES